MKIITEPTVHPVAKTVFIEHPTYKIPADGSDPCKVGSFTAKGCYDSFGEDDLKRSNTDNQAKVIANQHGSVLEHISLSLFVEGISRGCSHEIVRHRAGWAYSQRSTRYTEETGAAIVLEPYMAQLYKRHQDLRPEEWETLSTHISGTEAGILVYPEHVEQLIRLNPYNHKGVALRKWGRGIARQLLPHALETRMTMTGNIRAWRHFMGMRSAADAEAEIRRLAAAIFPHLREYAPEHFADFTEHAHPTGIIEYRPGVWKV